VDHYGVQAMESINNMELSPMVAFDQSEMVDEMRKLNRSFSNRPIYKTVMDKRGFNQSVINGVNRTHLINKLYV